MDDEIALFGAADPQDAAIVELSDDQRAVLAKELSEQIFGFKHIVDLLTKDAPISRGLLRSVLYMAEHRTVDACKMAAIELDSVAEQERRYANIRALNEKVRQLRTQLGQAATPEQTAAHLKVCSENLSKWWRHDGFGHVSEVFFTEYGYAKVELSCHLYGDFSLTMSKTPVSDKERRVHWLQELRDQGFVLVQDERDVELVDCDQNRTAIFELLAKAIPSAKVVSTKNHSSRNGQMLLRSLHLYIYKLRDLHDLKPVSAQPRGEDL